MLEVFRVAFWQIDKKFAHNLKLLAHIRRISETLLLHLGQLFFLKLFFKNFCVGSVGPLIPLSWTSGDISSGF